jgi:hypothetical protein
MGNTCLMAQLSMAERNTASTNHLSDDKSSSLQDRVPHPTPHACVMPKSASFTTAPEKLMVYVALSGSPQGRSASGNTMPALAATSWICSHTHTGFLGQQVL